MVKTYMAVMAGGALGSAARLWMSSAVAMRYGDQFPWGTLAVNVLGCLIIGAFFGLTDIEGPWPAPLIARQFVIIGVLGGFTTFSSFSLQTVDLMMLGQWGRAAMNVGLSVACCLVATGAGLWISARFGHI